MIHKRSFSQSSRLVIFIWRGKFNAHFESLNLSDGLFYRKFDDLAKGIPAEIMDRVRLFRFLETKAEVDEFVRFCENSEYKKLRGGQYFILTLKYYTQFQR